MESAWFVLDDVLMRMNLFFGMLVSVKDSVFTMNQRSNETT